LVGSPVLWSRQASACLLVAEPANEDTRNHAAERNNPLCDLTFVAAETPSNLVAVIAISAAVFFIGDRMGRIESETWNLEASPDGLAARIASFGGADLTCFCLRPGRSALHRTHDPRWCARNPPRRAHRSARRDPGRRWETPA
jgi:hypothetical protein